MFSTNAILSRIMIACSTLFLAACQIQEASLKHFWVDLYEGEVVSTDAVVNDLAQAKVIYLGESHRVARHHEWQLELLKALTAQKKTLTLGLEMIERHFQPTLDQYNRREISFDTLVKAIDWEKRWGNYKSYQPLVEYAHASKIPLLALNARLETVRKVAKKGLSSLNPPQQKELPRINQWQNDPIYRKHLDKIMKIHLSVNDSGLEKIFQAQVLRDETMAEVISNHLKAHPERQMVAIIGAGHVNYGLGIPQRVRRAFPGIRDRIILFTVSGELTLSRAEQRQKRDIELTHQDLKFIPTPIADYLQVTENKDIKY